MKLTLITAIFASLVLLTGAACGGDDKDDDPANSGQASSTENGDNGPSVGNIRTAKGLTVAAVNAGLAPGGVNADSAESVLNDLPASGSGGDYAAGSRPAALAGEERLQLAPQADLSRAVNLQIGGAGITVSGYGTATADADSAVIEFYFGPIGDPVIDPSTGQPEFASPITETELQPVIDALAAAGVAREDIEVADQSLYDPYYRSVNMSAKIRDVAIVEAAAQAATDASAALSSTSLQSTNIAFTLSDCDAVQRAALEAAAEDAADQADVLAEVLGVGRGGIVGASDYSYPSYYYGYGGGQDDSVCASSYSGMKPFYTGVPLSGERSVEVFANVSVTYAIS